MDLQSEHDSDRGEYSSNDDDAGNTDSDLDEDSSKKKDSDDKDSDEDNSDETGHETDVDNDEHSIMSRILTKSKIQRRQTIPIAATTLINILKKKFAMRRILLKMTIPKMGRTLTKIKILTTVRSRAKMTGRIKMDILTTTRPLSNTKARTMTKIRTTRTTPTRFKFRVRKRAR